MRDQTILVRKFFEPPKPSYATEWDMEQLDNVADKLKSYFVKRLQMTVYMGCLMWNNKVVIPVSLQGDVVGLLHEQHIGFTKMMSLAISIVWWFGTDCSIEEIT